jgi:hypothetical protein
VKSKRAASPCTHLWQTQFHVLMRAISIHGPKRKTKILSDADSPGFEHGSKNNTTSDQANSGEKAPIYKVRPLDRGIKFPRHPNGRSLSNLSMVLLQILPFIMDIYSN